MCQNSFLYFISTPSNYLLLRFWFYLRYKIKSTFFFFFFFFDLYLLSFNLLHFISTPYNRSLTYAWFYLRYKIKSIQNLVLSFFPVVLKVVNFLLPYFCSVFSLLCRKPVVQIFSTNYARSFCSQLGGVCCLFHFLFLLQLCQRFLLLWLCINVL